MDEITKSKTNASEDAGPRPTISRRRSLIRSKSTPEYDSHHLYSPQFMDDHGAHHYHPYSPSRSDDSTLNEEETPIDEIETEKGSDYEEDEEEDIEVRDGVVNLHDLESRQTRQSKLARTRSNRSAKDPYLVSWDGEDDPMSPKNWKNSRKWAATVVVSCFTFISPVSSSMVAPALPAMAKSLNIATGVEESLVLSIFVLAYAIGPLFLGPLSEIYGRVIVLQVANLFFLAFNIACGFATTKGQLIAFRFLSGLGGSAPLALGGGVLSDCFRAEERGKAISIYSLAPLLGPAVGPIAGGFIAEKSTWRWVRMRLSFRPTKLTGFFSVFGLQVLWMPPSKSWDFSPCERHMLRNFLHENRKLCARRRGMMLTILNGRHQIELSRSFSKQVSCDHSFSSALNQSCRYWHFIWRTAMV